VKPPILFASGVTSTYGSYWLQPLTFAVAVQTPSLLITSSELPEFITQNRQNRRKTATQSYASAKVLADRQAAEGMNGF
jgi:hypothetical protein